MSIADRVRKLAALAGSDNEHEANAAARQACQLIREGKVVIEDLEPQDHRHKHPTHSVWEAFFRQATRPPEPPPKPARRVVHGPFTHKPDVFASSCAVCNERIDRGDAFACEEGFVHGDCIPSSKRP